MDKITSRYSPGTLVADEARKEARKSRSRRPSNGTALLELVGIAFIVVVMALLSINLGVLVFAAWLNDSACRDACRAASQQGSSESAKAAAVIACKQFATSAGGVVGDPKVLLDSANFEYESYPDTDGKPTVSKGPYVRVTTSLNSKLPAPVILSNVGFTDLLVFRQTYTFPLLEPDATDTGDSEVDPALAQQEEDDLQKIADAAAAEGADVNIPGSLPDNLPTTIPDNVPIPDNIPSGLPENLPEP